MGHSFELSGFKKKSSDGIWSEVEIPSYMLGYVGRHTLYMYLLDSEFKKEGGDWDDHGYDSYLRYDLLLKIKDNDLDNFNEKMLYTKLGLIMNVLEAMRDEFKTKTDELCCVLSYS